MCLIPSYLTGTCRRLGREPCGLRGSGPRLSRWHCDTYTCLHCFLLGVCKLNVFRYKVGFYVHFIYIRKEGCSVILYIWGQTCKHFLNWRNISCNFSILLNSLSFMLPKKGDRGNSITVQFVLFKKPEAGPCPPVPAPPLSDSTCVALT